MCMYHAEQQSYKKKLTRSLKYQKVLRWTNNFCDGETSLSKDNIECAFKDGKLKCVCVYNDGISVVKSGHNFSYLLAKFCKLMC